MPRRVTENSSCQELLAMVTHFVCSRHAVKPRYFQLIRQILSKAMELNTLFRFDFEILK